MSTPTIHRETTVQPSRGAWPTSFEVADFAVPTGREEAWRFSPVRELRTLLGAEDFSGQIEATADVPAGVTFEKIARESARELPIGQPADRPAAQAMASTDAVHHLHIPADTELDEPIEVLVNGSGTQATAQHVVIQSGTHSAATVIIRHNGTSHLTQAVSVIAGDGSRLRVVSSQEWDDNAIHLAQHDITVGRDAHVTHVAVSLSGHIVRMSANVHYAGPGATAKLYGAYLANSGQHIEHRSFADHTTANCESNVIYKGALNGATARTVWVGDVQIRAAATGTETYELNRNLILTEGARADSIPNLEIETGDIAGAGHASATGRFDDDQLFYLMARGIPRDQARRLVVRGFFADIMRHIGDSELAETLMDRVDAGLAEGAE